MLHRITRLAPLLLILAMSGCVFFPDHGRHHDHRHDSRYDQRYDQQRYDHRYDDGRPGYNRR